MKRKPAKLKTSLIIIAHTFGERQHLCLASVGALSPMADETIFVFDGEASAAAPVDRDLAPSVRVVTGRGLGRAAARNDGASVASGDVLAFIDGDILTAPDFLAHHLSAMSQGADFTRGRVRELVGAAARASLADCGPGFPGIDIARLAQVGFSPAGFRQSTSRLEQAVEARHVDAKCEIPPWIASAGANFAVSHDLWRSVGGQEERFGRSWGCEDLEFSFRASREAGGVVYLPEAAAWHMSHPQPHRWEAHATALKFFCDLHPYEPRIPALSALLSENGSLEAYLTLLACQSRRA